MRPASLRTIIYILAVVLCAVSVSAQQTLPVRAIPVDKDPMAIEARKGEDVAFALSKKDRALYALGLSEYHVVERLELSEKPMGLAINPADASILVTASKNSNTGYLYIIGTDFQYTKTITIAGDVQGLTINPEDNTAIIALGRDKKLLLISTETHQMIGQISLPHRPLTVSFDSESRKAIVIAGKASGQGRQNIILIVDMATGTVIKEVETSTEITGIAADGKKGLLVASAGQNTYVIEMTSGALLSTIQTEDSAGVTINPMTHIAVISVSDGIILLDLETISISNYYLCGKTEKTPWTRPSASRSKSHHCQDVKIGPLAMDYFKNTVLVGGHKEVIEVKLPQPTPVINSILPDQLLRGSNDQALNINGENFLEISVALLRSGNTFQQISPVFIDADNIQVPVPDAMLVETGSWDLIITNDPTGRNQNGASSLPKKLQVVNPVPAISSLQPSDIMAGTQSLRLDIYGNSFFSDTNFYINGAQRVTSYESRSKAHIDLSASDMEYGRYLDVSAFNQSPGGGYSQTARLTVLNPLPVLISLNPNETLINAPLTMNIQGSGFVKTSSVKLSGQSLPFVYQGWTNLGVDIPASLTHNAGYYQVEVSNPAPGGGLSNLLSLTVKNPVPVLVSLIPAVIIPNGDVTINLTGSGFVPASKILLDGADFAASFRNSNELSVLVPAVALASPGGHTVSIINPLPGGGISNPLTLTSGGFTLPDPITTAPPVDDTVATTMLSATAFLYIGADPIQKGVAPGTIELIRVAVIRGKVFDRNGSAISGAVITIQGHPEFGYTISREDGVFDMAVNGGSTLTVNYNKPGYLRVQRMVDVPWQDYVWAPDIVMIQLDARATSIDLLSSAPIQAAMGSPVSDESGTRQAVLLFNQGTTSVMTFADGSTRPLSNLTIRATEYTVGPSGPAAMPGPMPANVAYTYAVEFSADEAIAAGAKGVHFSRPVINYVDNFLHFDVGIPVPAAYYDANLSVWVPSDDGRVVRIISVLDGIADLDINGSGNAASDMDLAELGVTEAELQQLALIYQPGQSFWRVPIAHFTPCDLNWAFGGPPDSTGPNQENPTAGFQPYYSCSTGCVIEVQNRVLGEVAEISGTPFSLNYRSSRVSGGKAGYSISIPLSGATVPASLKRIDLEVYVAGRAFKFTFRPEPDQSFIFTWDGKDAYGRTLQGAQPITVKIGYAYEAVYRIPGSTANFRSFGSFPSNLLITGDRARQEIIIWQTLQGTVATGNFNAQAQGFGGWTLSSQHVYDPVGRVLYLGNGSERRVSGMNDVTETIAGSGQAGFGGDGGKATQGRLNSPAGMAIDAGGNSYIADRMSNRIRKIDANGVITTIAGSGQAGFGGDGGTALQALLNGPAAVAIDSYGNIYIADELNNRIRKIDASGLITTIAGSGQSGFEGDYGAAIAAKLNRPSGVAADTDGNVYIADTYNHRTRKINPGGVISTIAGNGQATYGGDGGPAANAGLNRPSGITVTPEGYIYIADQLNNRIRKIDVSGVITTVAGNGAACTMSGCGDGGPALQASLTGPTGVAADRSGNMLIADTGNSRIRRVDPTGGIITIAGNGQAGYGGDNGSAAASLINQPAGIAVSPSGAVFIADSGNSRIREITMLLPGVSASDIIIPSEGGNEYHVFNFSGRHNQTLDSLTGAILYSFSYDPATGRLTEIKDGYGNATSISREGSNTVYITAPGGQMTTLSLDEKGWLSGITDQAGHMIKPAHTLDGLLASFTDQNGNTNYFTYDSMGRLIRDDDAAGGSKTLSRTDFPGGFMVSLITAMGLESTYKVENSLGTVRRTDTFPQSGQHVTVTKQDGTSEETSPDGMVTSKTKGPDPRFGMLSPVTTRREITTPGGLKLSLERSRTADISGSLTESFNVNNRTYTKAYNAYSRTMTFTTPMGRKMTTTLNDKGKVISIHVAGLNPANFGYDTKGRLESVTQGTGADTRLYTINYDAQNRISDLIDPMSKTMIYTYDPADHIIQETLPGSRVISYGHDAKGNVTSITPPGRPAHEFDYTPVDLAKTYMPPDIGAASKDTGYSYDLDRRLKEETRPMGYILPYAEDVNLSYTYDGSLPTSLSWTGAINGSVGFVYDNDFRIATQTLNNANAVGFAYDDDGLLTGAGALSIDRDPNNGLVTGTALGNVTDTLTYNGFGEPDTYSASFGGSQFMNDHYERDKLGRITFKAETVGGITHVYGYFYDDAGRLKDVEEDGVLISHYECDANGNRLLYNSVTATYDAQDRLKTYGNYEYEYTDNGELARKTGQGGITQYGYDAFGNLTTAILPDGTNITYIVDGENRRIEKKINGTLTQGFLYEDQLRPVAELDGNGNIVSRFVYGTKINVPDYMIKNGVTYRIITDHLGSPKMVADVSTGQIVQRMEYDEFGNVVSDNNPGFQPFGFAGGIYDLQTKLTRLGARDYDAVTGKWTAKDPIGFAGGDANLFGYTGSDPVNWIDPTGLTIMTWIWPAIIVPPLIPVIVPILPVIIPPVVAGIVIFWPSPIEQDPDISADKDWNNSYSKGGTQNYENEWTRNARMQPDPCSWLREQYNKTQDSFTRMKIKKAQKVLGCRRSTCDK